MGRRAATTWWRTSRTDCRPCSHSSLVDITDICDRAANKYGGWLPAGEAIGKVKGKWYGFPDFAVPFLSAWRTDLWKAAGFSGDHLVNWQDLFDYAPKLKAAGNPIGCGDVADLGCRAHLAVADVVVRRGRVQQGRHAGRDRQQGDPARCSTSRRASSRNEEPAVLSWADVDNNTYLQSGKGAWIYNPISAYRTIEAQNPDLAAKITVDNPFKGPIAQICSMQFTVYGIWNFSKNIDAARQFLIDYSDDWPNQMTASKGYNNPFLKGHAAKPMPVLGADAKLSQLQDIANFIQPVGYPGPSSQAAYDTLNTHTVTDMFTSYATGNSTADAAIAAAKKRLEASLVKFPL